MPDSLNNRRKFPRIDYKCQLTVWCVDGRSEVLLCKTNNVGAGGISIDLNKSLLLGCELDLRIDFTLPSIPLKCKGKVVRCNELGESKFEIGIEFDGLDDVKRSFLEGKISELLEKEKNENT